MDVGDVGGLAAEDSAMPLGSGILAQDSVQQLVTLRGLCATLARIRVSISVIRGLDQMGEKGHFHTEQDVSPEAPDPSVGWDPGTSPTFLLDDGTPPRVSVP